MREARRFALLALRLSTARDAEYGAALALALTNNLSEARALADDLAKRFHEDTVVRFSYLPVLRAVIAMNHREPRKAIELLQAARTYELGFQGCCSVGFAGSLYPIYVRGEALLAANQGAEAAGEFQKILDHRGIVVTDPISALAHLQLGRAFVKAQQRVKAKTAYEEFLALWRDADPNVPILKKAKAEYLALQ
jgi:tetratricopeptide (TPR) repeat protein